MNINYLKAAILAVFPTLDKPKLVFARVTQKIAERYSVQAIATNEGLGQRTIAEVCSGVPGVTSDPTEGEQVIVLFVGKDEIPYVLGRASEKMPGFAPVEVRHDAKSAIRLLSKAISGGAKVYVGSTTAPVAMASPVASAFVAVKTFATAAKASTDPAVGPAALALEAALGDIDGYASTNLEAQ